MPEASKKISPTTLYAAIASGLLIAVSCSAYLAGPAAFISNSVYFAYLGVLVLGIAGVLTEKKRQGNVLYFQPAVRSIFIVFVVSLAAQTLFVWLLLHVADPAFRDKLAPLVAAKKEAIARWAGLSEDKVREQAAADKGTDPFGLSGMLLGLARDYIVCFLVSLLIAAVVKTTKPSPRPTGL